MSRREKILLCVLAFVWVTAIAATQMSPMALLDMANRWKEVQTLEQGATSLDVLIVGTTKDKTTIDQTSGITTPTISIGTPLATAKTEKKVFWANMVDASGVTAIGFSMAVEMNSSTASAIISGATFYALRTGVEIPIFSTYGLLWADPVSGASAYYSGGSLYVRNSNGTIRKITDAAP